MNKLKFSWILWGIIMIAIVVLLFFIGIKFGEKTKPYKQKEKELVDIAKVYVESNTWYPSQGKKIKITIDELIQNGFIKDVVVDNDKCDGYIDVFNNSVIEYKAFIKCSNYETREYKK